MTNDNLTDGVYYLDRGAYSAIPAVTQSLLKQFKRSPAHARESMLHPKEPSEALNFGNAIHCAILEPDRFVEDYVVAPKIERRSAAGKAAWIEFEDQNRGKEIISQDDYSMCQRMMESCYANDVAAALLSGNGRNEVTLLWTDRDTDVRCKALLDRVTSFLGWTCVIDIKSTRDASQRGFARQVAQLEYHLQAAFYLEGLNALSPADRRFLFVAIEKESPYCVTVFELEDESLKQGAAAFRQHLKTYAQCVTNGVWPGYPIGIVPLQIPTWAMEGDFNGSD